nr:hypothetical protein [Angustibacter aerolatus]
MSRAEPARDGRRASGRTSRSPWSAAPRSGRAAASRSRRRWPVGSTTGCWRCRRPGCRPRPSTPSTTGSPPATSRPSRASPTPSCRPCAPATRWPSGGRCATTCSGLRCRCAPSSATSSSLGQEYGALGGVVSGSGPTVAFLVRDHEHALDLSVALTASGACEQVRRAHGPVHGVRTGDLPRIP